MRGAIECADNGGRKVSKRHIVSWAFGATLLATLLGVAVFILRLLSWRRDYSTRGYIALDRAAAMHAGGGASQPLGSVGRWRMRHVS